MGPAWGWPELCCRLFSGATKISFPFRSCHTPAALWSGPHVWGVSGGVAPCLTGSQQAETAPAHTPVHLLGRRAMGSESTLVDHGVLSGKLVSAGCFQLPGGLQSVLVPWEEQHWAFFSSGLKSGIGCGEKAGCNCSN